jgi:hypothetical protein
MLKQITIAPDLFISTQLQHFVGSILIPHWSECLFPFTGVAKQADNWKISNRELISDHPYSLA